MIVDIDEKIWNTDMGVVARSIYLYCLINNVTDYSDEFFKKIVSFTNCYEKNVKFSINKLIDLGVLNGEKIEIVTKKGKNNNNEQTPEMQSTIDKFIEKFKVAVNDKYKEYSSKYSKILASDALGLVITCFRRNLNKYDYFDSIPKNELIALYDVAMDYKRKTPEYESIRNPLAVITSKINELLESEEIEN